MPPSIPRLWVPIIGDSMWPTLRAGDEVAVEPCEEPPSAGEVVVARAGTAFIAHRVVRADGPQILLRGDNAEEDDPWMPLSLILGRVRAVRRGGRDLSSGWDRGPTWAGKLRARVKRRVSRWVSAP